MKRARYGRIVNVSSRAARVKDAVVPQSPAYTAAKAGVMGLTRFAARAGAVRRDRQLPRAEPHPQRASARGLLGAVGRGGAGALPPAGGPPAPALGRRRSCRRCSSSAATEQLRHRRVPRRQRRLVHGMRRRHQHEASMRLLIPFPAGGSTEFTALTLAGPMGRLLGEPVSRPRSSHLLRAPPRTGRGGAPRPR